MDNNDSDILIALLFGTVLAAVITVLFFISTKEGNMYIAALYWQRDVIEFYETRQTNCSLIDGKTSCETRVIETITNRWTSSGSYPEEPKWPEFSTSPGRKKRTKEVYRVSFSSNDEKTYNYYTSLHQYKTFRPEQIFYVKINIYSVVFSVGKRRPE